MRTRSFAVAPLALALAGLGVFACRGGGGAGDTPDAAASPQASAVPAPLANASGQPAVGIAPAVLDSGAPYPTLRADTPLESDVPPRDGPGYTLSAVLRPTELTGPPRAPEVNAAGLDAARKKTEPRLAIELAASRMRVVFQGAGFVVPPETELRARFDRLGHVVVWPGATLYRPLAPGSLRALLADRRYDVAPLASAQVASLEETGKRIGIKTRKVEVGTRAAKLTMELGKLEGLGESGILLCRLLLDLANGSPTTPVCTADEVPLRAELKWASRGSLGFEVTGVLRRTDVPGASLLVPPQAASFGDLPPVRNGLQGMLAVAELAALRTGPVEVPAGPAPAGDGLLVANNSDQVRVLFVDGVPVAWVAPGGKDGLYGLVRGKYVAQWRSFLGDVVDAPASLFVPGASIVGGAPDAGAPAK